MGGGDILNQESGSSGCNFLRLFEGVEDEIDYKNGPLLAHYTSISNLESILRNKEIWFSNPLYLNDFDELRFGMNEGRDILLYDDEVNSKLRDSVKTQDNLEILKSHFNDIFSQFEAKHALDTFVLSFCRHEEGDEDGKLSMWRSYGSGGNGACIVFDSKKLSAVEESPLIFGRVTYSPKAERKNQLKRFCFVLCEELAKAADVEKELYVAAHYFFERLKFFGLFSKHSGFREEDEFRLVYLADRDQDKLLSHCIGYHLSPNGIQPKLKLPIKPIAGVTPNDLDFENIINCILLGPTTSSILSQKMFEKMLSHLNLESLTTKLKACTIPFRTL